MKVIWIGLFFVAILAIGSFTAFGSSLTGAAISGGSGYTSLSLSDITSTAKWYKYDSGGTEIRFFAVKASDGSIKTGFDACDVCYGSHKGYRQEGDYMVCNNCGNKYPINGLGTENKNPGGCWPGFLPNTVSGDNLLIKNADIEGGKWRFA
ncbi:MAG: DUF2318 domain-containing protein [Candidatus Aenigmatarchaeota archaeon]